MTIVGRRAGTRALMERYGVKPVKSLGQNFLNDANIVRKIAELAEPGPDDVVCEIGPGLGALTVELAARAGRVVAVEKDARLVAALEHSLAGDSAGSDTAVNNVSVVHADFLEYDLSELPSGYKLTGNLPYYITTPAVMKAVESSNMPSLIVIMTQ
jgi:16S rRNA (adenine1518-N6/adenine1519-N6)-dimethyltransferase